MPQTLTPVAALYQDNAQQIARLGAMVSIDAGDLVEQHRHVRFQVACDHWGKLTAAGKAVLLNDGHAHVRSAAAISARDDGDDLAEPAACDRHN